jgi:hypothetical protein
VVNFFVIKRKKGPPFSQESTRREILYRKTGGQILRECRVPNTPIIAAGKIPPMDAGVCDIHTNTPTLQRAIWKIPNTVPTIYGLP